MDHTMQYEGIIRDKVDPTWRVTLRVGLTGYDVTLTNRLIGACYHAPIAQTNHTGGTDRRVA